VIVQFNGVSKSFGTQTILRDASFQINPDDKVGLIGANGAGKTTLLNIALGIYEADSGSVARKSTLQIGSLDQIPEFHEGTSVLDEALRASDYLRQLEHEMHDLEHAIAAGGCTDTLDRYSHVQHEFELKGGYSYRARTESALQGVGFSRDALDRPVRNLSGGEQNRLALAKLLLSSSELLLLDEPTNHLDIRSIEWLEKFLKDTDKTFIVVSHDRVFLDRVVNRILEVENGSVQDYRGNYSDYLKQRADRLDQQQKQRELQREWIEKQEDYIRRNIAGQKTKQAQSRRKLLARVKPIEKLKTTSTTVRFRFAPVERSGRYVLSVRDLAIGYNEQPLVQKIQFEIQRGERWALLGANGSGKTTLLKTLIGSCKPLGGEVEWNEGLDTAYYDQQLQDLDPGATVLDEIRELDSSPTDGELRSYLAQFLFTGEDILKNVGQLSGGEKSRLALARIIYVAPQLLALDEPTNHLDIRSREALESALLEYPGTILFVTHDRYLVQKIATHLLYIENDAAHVFDRLSAFEEWLNRPAPVSASTTPVTDRRVQIDAKPRTLSKNKREQLEKEIVELEQTIGRVEADIAQLELCFQNPPPGSDWETMHRQYSELKRTLETLYEDLGRRWEVL
jgi:ATP-binding cassette subfamily F protein 3